MVADDGGLHEGVGTHHGVPPGAGSRTAQPMIRARISRAYSAS